MPRHKDHSSSLVPSLDGSRSNPSVHDLSLSRRSALRALGIAGLALASVPAWGMSW